ncbi:MAG: hypothetical protein JNL88_11070 [Bacteroidia bacterium]|nr:hypothetical protein [Bacteroidia bacterium]
MHYTLGHRFTGHQGSVYALEHDFDLQHFYSGAGDKIVARWSLEQKGDGDLVARATDAVYCLHLLREQHVLLIGQGAGGVHVIALMDGKEERLLQLHEGPVFGIGQSRKHELLFTLGGDGVLCRLERGSLDVLQRLRITEKKLRAFALYPEEQFALIGCGDGSVVVLELPEGRVVERLMAHQPGFSVNALAFSPDGRYFLSGSRDAHLHLYETDGLKRLESIPAHNYAIYDIAFHPGGRRFATASRDKSVKLWDFERMEVLERLEGNDGTGHINSVNKLLWLADGTLLSAGDDRAIQAWSPLV